NIIAEIICVLVKDAKKVLKSNGVFITSGIINDRVDMVKDKLLEENFEVIEVINQGEWNCIVAKVK
ncbi:MAG: 50S ribosomal protein L11 methyltransferase, partial [Clostridiaceae bacterium]